MRVFKTAALTILLCAASAYAPPGWAQQNGAPANPPAGAAPGPAIEPKAIELLNAMGAKLDAAKTMSFSVRTAFEEPARNGQPLFYMVQASVSLERPDKMKIVTSGDGPPSEFLYDGKTIMQYLPSQNMVAETGAPPELGAMLDEVYEKYGFYFPFIHYLVDQSHEKLIDGLTSAFVIGQSKLVGGTTTDMVAIANDNVQVQMWIGSDDKLPRQLWLTFTHAPQKPLRMTEFSDWKLDQPIDMTPPDTQSAEKIDFARPDAAATK